MSGRRDPFLDLTLYFRGAWACRLLVRWEIMLGDHGLPSQDVGGELRCSSMMPGIRAFVLWEWLNGHCQVYAWS